MIVNIGFKLFLIVLIILNVNSWVKLLKNFAYQKNIKNKIKELSSRIEHEEFDIDEVQYEMDVLEMLVSKKIM